MDIRDSRGLQAAAAQSLQRGGSDYKKCITQHTGVILAATFVLTLVKLLLDQGIADTGGLSGVGMRAMLETAQSVLQLLQMAVLPFWQFGWLAAALALSREETVEFSDLTVGFRRFWPVLRLTVLLGVVYVAIGMVAGYLGTAVFMLTPWAEPIAAVYAQMLGGGDAQALMAAMEEAIQQVMVPLMIVYVLVYLVLAVPVSYRLRLARYCLAEDGSGRALAALGRSRRLMRGNVMAMVRLDLRFWWFYALDLLVSVVSWLDVLLPAVGVKLPWPDWVGYLVFLTLYSLCQLALYRWCKPQVDVTYAKAYFALSEPGAARPRPAPTNLPWQTME